MKDFDWDSPSEDCCILRGPEDIAIYYNPRGEIVLRQNVEYGHGDAIIVIHPKYLPGLISQIKDFIDAVVPPSP